MTFPRQSNHARRASRARELAERSPASAEPLSFIAAVIAEQSRLDTRTPRPIGAEQAAAPRQSPADLAGPIARLAQHSGPLIELVLRQGPPPLRDEAQSLDEAGCREALDRLVHLEDTTSTRSFFARVLLQAVWASNPPHSEDADSAARPPSPPTTSCPECGHPPQLGVVRRVGDGSEFRLMCSLCLGQWSFPRNGCPACGESEEGRIAYYGAADEFAHLKVRACETCRRYLLQVDLSKEPRSVPDIDEMAALPLDVWATGQGLWKLYPNLLGI